MKKNYVKPAIAVEEILFVEMIATSTGFGGDGEGEEADANEKRGWGNLWN